MPPKSAPAKARRAEAAREPEAKRAKREHVRRELFAPAEPAVKARARVPAGVKTASRRSELERFHRDVLFAWASDYAGVDVPAECTREFLLNLMAGDDRFDVPTPAAAALLWRSFYDKGRKAKMPEPDEPEEEASDGDAEESVASVESVDEPAQPARKSPAKKARHRCLSCARGEAPEEDERWHCDNCGLRGDLEPATALALEARMRERGAAAATPGTPNSTHDREKETPSEREWKRLAARGAPYPIMTSTDPLKAADVTAIMRGAFGATRYAYQPEALTALIASGKLERLAQAQPRLDEDNHHQTDVLKIDAGALTVSNKLADARLSGVEDAMIASLTVMSTLVGQPRALVEWMALLVTVVRLSKERSWPVASAYLDRQLKDKVPLRAAFGQYDDKVGNQVILDHAAGAPKHAAPARSLFPDQKLPCRGFNRGRCVFEDSPQGCHFKHECSVSGCPNPGSHSALNCPRSSRGREEFHRGRGRGGRGRGERQVRFAGEGTS